MEINLIKTKLCLENHLQNKDDLQSLRVKKDASLNKIKKFINFHKYSNQNNFRMIENDHDYVVENFHVYESDYELLRKSAFHLLEIFPIDNSDLKSFLNDILVNNYLGSTLSINKGNKIKLDKNNKEIIKYEKWCNVLNRDDYKDIIFTLHYNTEINKNKTYKYSYILENNKFKLSLFYNEEVNKEIKTTFSYVDKLEMNKNDIHIKLDTNNKELRYNNNKCIDSQNYKSERILNLNKNFRIEETYEKQEKYYSERTFECYELSDCHSSGHKYYENSCHRKYKENWWKWNQHNTEEIKISRSLDDGFGVKTHEELGYLQNTENKTILYNFHDKSVDYVDAEEIITTKVGFSDNKQWNSYIVNNKKNKTNLVENYGKEGIHEWFEKWYENQSEKYSFKWGKDSESEWEEEWKELYQNDIVEKNCYKKCNNFNADSYWLETWNEKHHDDNRIEKTCFKQNQSEEKAWGDKLINKEQNKWLHYHSYKNNNGVINHHQEEYSK